MNGSLPEGVLFDLDDTLIAYDAVADLSWKAVCESFSEHAGDAEDLYRSISRHREWYWSDPERHKRGRHDLGKARWDIVGAALGELGRRDDHRARQIVEAYGIVRDRNIYLLPNALETLIFFTRMKVPMVLVTNGPKDLQSRKIRRFSLASHFRAIFIEGELGFGKPDLRVYEQALKALGVPPGRVWSVGDNLEWDVLAPQRLGMTGIWHDYRRTGLPVDVEVQPKRTIHEIRELVLT